MAKKRGKSVGRVISPEQAEPAVGPSLPPLPDVQWPDAPPIEPYREPSRTESSAGRVPKYRGPDFTVVCFDLQDPARGPLITGESSRLPAETVVGLLAFAVRQLATFRPAPVAPETGETTSVARDLHDFFRQHRPSSPRYLYFGFDPASFYEDARLTPADLDWFSGACSRLLERALTAPEETDVIESRQDNRGVSVQVCLKNDGPAWPRHGVPEPGQQPQQAAGVGGRETPGLTSRREVPEHGGVPHRQQQEQADPSQLEGKTLPLARPLEEAPATAEFRPQQEPALGEQAHPPLSATPLGHSPVLPLERLRVLNQKLQQVQVENIEEFQNLLSSLSGHEFASGAEAQQAVNLVNDTRDRLDVSFILVSGDQRAKGKKVSLSFDDNQGTSAGRIRATTSTRPQVTIHCGLKMPDLKAMDNSAT